MTSRSARTACACDEPLSTPGGTDTGIEPPGGPAGRARRLRGDHHADVRRPQGLGVASTPMCSLTRVHRGRCVRDPPAADARWRPRRRPACAARGIANRCPVHRILMNEVRVEDVEYRERRRAALNAAGAFAVYIHRRVGYGTGTMHVIPVSAVHRGFGTTRRRDAWWAAPLAVFVGLSAFVVYATWAAFQGEHYTYGPYLSPFYSPELFGDSPHAWFGTQAARLAGVVAVLGGAAHPAVPRPVPLHLLLLPRRVLQVVLGRSAVMRRRRAAHALPRRELAAADPPERPPLLHVGGAGLHRLPGLRRVAGLVVPRSGDRRGASSASASARSSWP